MPLLSGSRARNMSSLKAALRRRRQSAKKVNSNLKGVEKRRSALRTTLVDVNAAVAAAISQAQHLPVTPEDIGRPITAERASRLEKLMRKNTTNLSMLTTKVGLLLKELMREDTAQAEAEDEMKKARKSVDTFMNDTMRLVNEITTEVTEDSPDYMDDLRDRNINGKPRGDGYLLSSLFRVRTRPRNAPAAGLYPRRRGATVQKAQATTAPLAVKGASLSVPALTTGAST